MRRQIITLSLALLTIAQPGRADEGMWLVNRFPKEELKRKYGVALTDEFLRHLQMSSVRFNSGGSGSFISPNGLLFTNHHVGAECIFKVSAKEHDYMKDGFQARANGEEKACPDLEVNVLLRIETVTDKVNDGVAATTAPAEANRIRQANITRLESACNKATGNRCDVVIPAGSVCGY